MGLKDRTKWMFTEELQNILKTMSLSKVHIKDLCSRCGVKRQVFYYHFKDKYDLVAWIFTQDFIESLKTAGGQPGVFQLAKVLTLLQEKDIL